MKIVISGGLGYVGGRLSKYFAEHGHEVIALSRQAGQLGSIDFPVNMKVLHPDSVMADRTAILGADVFIHLAAMNENDCVKYPLKAIEVNITGTVRWLDVAIESGISRFIYFSTAHVYAKPLEGYFDENSLTRPVHPYAITHKSAEDYVLAYASDKGMSNIVIRLTNAFGGPAFPTADRWTLLVNDLCRSAAESHKMTLLSDGMQRRDFVPLEDVCAATLLLSALPYSKGRSEVINLGGGQSRTVWDMALMVKQVSERYLGVPVDLIRKQPESGIASSAMNINVSKLLSLGFVPTGDPENEIYSTLEYFHIQLVSRNGR